MHRLTLQNYQQKQIAQLADFFNRYLNQYPDAKLNRAEFYTYHPALESGENAFCVLDSDQEIVGFAPLFPVITMDEKGVTGPHDLWTIILAAPGLGLAGEVREMLLRGILERVTQLKAVYGVSRVRIAADMMVSQQPDIEFLLQKGLESFERVNMMRWDSRQSIPEISVPSAITFRQSKLTAEEEQSAYLEAFRACFPDTPKTMEEFQMLLQSPLWEKGRAITAYSPANEYIGSILVYFDDQKGYGVTDDVMVLPGWRGQGIAKSLIGEGLRYFRNLDMTDVRLEVKASNAPAVSVYTAMGYRIINQETLLGKYI